MTGKIYCTIIGWLSIFCIGWELFTVVDGESVTFTIRYTSFLIIMVLSWIFCYLFDILEEIKNKK